MRQLPLGMSLEPKLVFDSFATGMNGELIAALQAGGAQPLWLWGSRGSGKTHLLQAVCAKDGENAAYFPLSRSLGLPAAALLGFESCSVLCVDDVQSVAGDLAWEEALFHLFNAAFELRHRLIFAASVAPRQPAWALEDWRSRASACVVYQLRDLDEAGRAEALRLRAAQHGLELPPETSDYLLRRLPRDLPTLFEILDQLDQASLAAQRRLTIPFIRDALERHAETKP